MDFYHTKFILFFVCVLFLSCVQEEAQEELVGALGAGELPIIERGVAFDPSGMTACSTLFDDQNLDEACLAFTDSFERENLNEGVFHWREVIMDNGRSGSHIDAEISNANHLGSIYAGYKALLFRGRAGGSTHEIYLVSAPMNLQGFDFLYIQFHYLPIHLENEITLSWNNQTVAEGVRVDICNTTDETCGLDTGDFRKIRDPQNWDQFFIEGEHHKGRDFNLRSYTDSDWQLGQIAIDLRPYRDRADRIVIKFTMSLDEGYFRNNSNNLMEDGLILDDLMAIGVNSQFLF